MPQKIEERVLKASLEFFHDWKSALESEKMDKRFNELFEFVEKSEYLQEIISLRDIRDAIEFVVIYLNKSLQDISDVEFIKYIKSNLLTTKTYHFYYPIYNLYNFPKNIRLGHCVVLTFEDLLKLAQEDFISMWKHHFKIDTEYAKTEEEYVARKKRSTFLHLAVKSNGNFRAMDKAAALVEDSVHILRFLYRLHFPVNECRYTIEGSKNTGGRETIGMRFLGSGSYVKRFDKDIPELTNILIKPKPAMIERKLRNALKIFGIQTSVSNNQVRFVMLTTCLESLLLTESDRDYILWKLAEKTAFLLGRNKLRINDYVKLAYKKRSVFIHGKPKTKKDEIITEKDVWKIENIVVMVYWKLVDLVKEGYTEIQKKKDVKSIDQYLEVMKFGNDDGNRT